MSRIRVWIGSEGVWSEEFIGIDKVHFIKDAVLRWWEKAPGYYFSIYNAIYLAAKCPIPAPEGYCLLFKFKDE